MDMNEEDSEDSEEVAVEAYLEETTTTLHQCNIVHSGISSIADISL